MTIYKWIFPLKMVISHSYVSLPEGIWGYQKHQTWIWCFPKGDPFFRQNGFNAKSWSSMDDKTEILDPSDQ